MKATLVYSGKEGRWVVEYSGGGSPDSFMTTGQASRWMTILGPAQGSGEKIVAKLQPINPDYAVDFKLPA